MTFSIGDIVMLKDTRKHKLDALAKLHNVNLFYVEGRNDNFYHLSHVEEAVEENDILPVEVGSQHDLQLTLKYPPKAFLVDISNNYDIPELPREERYYMDIMKEKGYINNDIRTCQYVHEVQHKLREFYARTYIQINY